MFTGIRARAAVVILLLIPAVLTGCRGPAIIFGSPGNPGGTLGVSQRIATIRTCAGILDDIRDAARLASGSRPTGPAAAVDVAPLVIRLRKQAAAHPELPISKSLDRLIVALTALQRATRGTPAQLSAASEALGTAAEDVVTTCAAVGA